MICLAQYLYWDKKGYLISCKECPFQEKCTDKTKDKTCQD